jgi:hypothetical protein
MEQHEHGAYATHNEVNHFGKRVGAVEVSQAEERVKTKRNEEDIQNIFTLVETNAQTIGKVEKSVATLAAKLSGVLAAIVAMAEVVKYFLGK